MKSLFRFNYVTICMFLMGFFPCAFANIGVFNPRPITSEEANPFLGGMQQGQQYVQSAMMFPQQLRKQELDNEIKAAQLNAMEQEIAENNSTVILILSQDSKNSYLGCYSCNANDPESVFNEEGNFASTKATYSVYNTASPFGSRHSSLSACNSRASKPPYLIDNHGVFYGFLTLNTKLRQANKAPEILEWLKSTVCHIA